MSIPKIKCVVEHTLPDKNKVFAMQASREQQKKVEEKICSRYLDLLKDTLCDNKDHLDIQTVLVIQSRDNSFEIKETCCSKYKWEITKKIFETDNSL